MDDGNSDMLDHVLPSSGIYAEPSEHEYWLVDYEAVSHHTPPSSPMSLTEDFSHPSQNTFQTFDEDPTSHHQGLDLFAGIDNNVDTWTALPPSFMPYTSSARDQAVAQIELVFEDIADALLAEKDELLITLSAHRQTKASGGSGQEQRASRSRSTTIKFPGKSAEEAWRFTVVVRLLELVHDAICNETTITLRDIYYRDPALFGKQSVVDRYVGQIALAFGIPRNCMNVTAAAKGLIAGAARLCRRDGSILDLATKNGGTLIASVDDILSVEMNAVQWVMVIEKEATFQSIITSEEWQSLRWQGVIITGKGYPDMATRAMVRLISEATPRNGFASPPIFGLMDYDPDGLAILSTYKHGSRRFSLDSGALLAPRIQWLGLKSTHITDGEQTHRSQGLMALTKRDRHKARKMLEQEHMTEDGDELEWRSQLQVMLILNLKAELQILEALPGSLVGLVRSVVH